MSREAVCGNERAEDIEVKEHSYNMYMSLQKLSLKMVCLITQVVYPKSVPASLHDHRTSHRHHPSSSYLFYLFA